MVGGELTRLAGLAAVVLAGTPSRWKTARLGGKGTEFALVSGGEAEPPPVPVKGAQAFTLGAALAPEEGGSVITTSVKICPAGRGQRGGMGFAA